MINLSVVILKHCAHKKVVVLHGIFIFGYQKGGLQCINIKDATLNRLIVR